MKIEQSCVEVSTLRVNSARSVSRQLLVRQLQTNVGSCASNFSPSHLQKCTSLQRNHSKVWVRKTKKCVSISSIHNQVDGSYMWAVSDLPPNGRQVLLGNQILKNYNFFFKIGSSDKQNIKQWPAEVPI